MADASCSPLGHGDASPSPTAAAPEERRERRRIGALLTAYYGIEGTEQRSEQEAASSSAAQPPRPEAPLDREEFDAKRHFDSIVATGQVVDVVRHANEIDAEVRDLDGDMQMVVYENYSKFIRSMEVTRQLRASVEGLDPDLRSLEGGFARVTEHQRRVEEGVSGRAGRIEGLLRQQRVCRKLQILFDLPSTLQRCLDRGAYGQATRAYRCCAGALRQHRDAVPALRAVLQDVELQMGRIRSALEQRLRAAELSVEEAADSAATLLDLGQQGAQVRRDYLAGRAAALRARLERCFAAPPTEAPLSNGKAEEHPAAAGLQAAVAGVADGYIPELRAAAEGFRKLGAGSEADGGGAAADASLHSFVISKAHDALERLASLVEAQCPPVDVLVACIASLKSSIASLQALLPGEPLVAEPLADFTAAAAAAATRAIASRASAGLASTVAALHGECRRLQDLGGSAGLDALLETAAQTEQALLGDCLAGLESCRVLVPLAAELAVGPRLARGLRELIATLLLGFSRVCFACCGQDPTSDPSLPSGLGSPSAELQEAVGGLEWASFFGLALVWIGRRWEEKVVSKVAAVARDLIVGTGAGALEAELGPEAAVGRATQAGTEAAMARYVLVSGQHLAHFLRNAVWKRDWLSAKEPDEPSLVVEMVIKEVNSFDTQLARIFGDPRKPRGSSHRRVFNLNKTSMELELERMMARKLQAFAPTPLNRRGAVAGILRIAFKAFYEYLREQTFAKFGLQQVQVDANLFAELARDFVDAEDGNALGSLLGEAVHSASQRCAEPVLMEERAVEALCDRKKRSLRVE